MSDLVNQQLIDEMVKRQVAQDEFNPQQQAPKAKPNKFFDSRLARLLGTQMFDAATTDMFLRGKYASEANPIGRAITKHPAVMYGTKAGAGLLLNWIADKIENEGHPTAANIFDGAVTGAVGMVGANNLGVVRAKKANKALAAQQALMNGQPSSPYAAPVSSTDDGSKQRQ